MKYDLQGIINVTRAKPYKDGFSGHCPTHPDNNSSFLFRENEYGGLSVKCLSGCTKHDIFEYLKNIGVIDFSGKPKKLYYLNRHTFDKPLITSEHEIASQKAISVVTNNTQKITTGYLKRKLSLSISVLTEGKFEIFPCYDVNDKIWGYQRISESGDKFFLRGQRTSGTFFPIGDYKNAPLILVCEGVATGYSLHLALKYPVICTFSVTNMRAVILELNNKYPNKKIIIAGDNDHANK